MIIRCFKGPFGQALSGKFGNISKVIGLWNAVVNQTGERNMKACEKGKLSTNPAQSNRGDRKEYIACPQNLLVNEERRVLHIKENLPSTD